MTRVELLPRTFWLLAAAGIAVQACTPRRQATLGALKSGTGEEWASDRSTAQPVPRQLVRRGQMRVEVERVGESRARLERSLVVLGGQIARFEAHEAERADYLLRVPSDRLEALMDSTAALGKVKARTLSAEDVTEQVIDVEARLGALRASRDRLRQLLERGSAVADVVTVERELARVQGELESLEGRLNALRGQVAMSELSVRLGRRQVPGPLGLVVLGAGTLIKKLFIWS